MSLRHRKHVTHITHNDLHISCNSSTFQAQPISKTKGVCINYLVYLPPTSRNPKKNTRFIWAWNSTASIKPPHISMGSIYTSPERWPENSLFGTHKKPPGTQGTWRSPRACQPRKPRKANCSKTSPWPQLTASRKKQKKMQKSLGFPIFGTWPVSFQEPPSCSDFFKGRGVMLVSGRK